MNILVAIDRFEDILTSGEASSYIEEGVKTVYPNANVISVPLFDGQKHLIEGILSWQQGIKYNWQIQDANLRQREVTAAVIHDCLYIDCSRVFSQTADLLDTSSYGLGQMILNGLDLGYRSFTIALGESQVYDYGIGMLEKLGAVFFDIDDHKMTGPLSSAHIKHVRRIDLSGLDDRLSESTFKVISDLDYYLFGNKSQVADSILEDAVKMTIDNNIWYLNEQYKKAGLSVNPKNGGHAGGLRSIFESLFDARILSSKDMIFEETSLKDLLDEADAVIYGGGTVRPSESSLVAQAITQKAGPQLYIYLSAGQQFAPPSEAVHFLNIYPDMSTDTDKLKLGIQLQNSIKTILAIAKK
ncbi:glycerate kinase [Macrococcus brunensis]|uniref:glycerate kinase n=1 Tax=Macrococcus brunensis TaxID=198483 RepID=UPI001EF0DB31|nr:glycerate kinase [Macrococcus brunensis]ULG72527.1 glycerate kinase [Macrococcus brunensis]ULG74781.1 glycerate kinase [Macrococcus brunensis]